MSKRLNEIIQEAIKDEGKIVEWPDRFQNTKNGNFFKPQNDTVQEYITNKDDPYLLGLIGGEGSGKTATGSCIALNKLRRGMDGILLTPSFPYLLKIWNETRNWIDPVTVIDDHKYMLRFSWQPYKPFAMMFHNEQGGISTFYVAAVGESYTMLESLSLSFYWVEEARSLRDDTIMKIAPGRLRIPGPKGEPSQLFITSSPTPKSHWLYKYFRPPLEEDDGLNELRNRSRIVALSTRKSIENGFVEKTYIETRGLTLNENERRMLIDGEFGEIDDDANYLYDPNLWYRLYDTELKPLRKKKDKERDFSDSCVIALDAGVKNDHFGVAVVTRHPDNRENVAVRMARAFVPTKGREVDYDEVREYLYTLLDEYSVLCITYDPYQLYDMAQGFRKSKSVWMLEFDQNKKRIMADTQLLMLIIQSRIWHMNDTELNKQMTHAGVKIDNDERKKRMVKRDDSKKIDIAVCVSMASYTILNLNV